MSGTILGPGDKSVNQTYIQKICFHEAYILVRVGEGGLEMSNKCNKHNK